MVNYQLVNQVNQLRKMHSLETEKEAIVEGSHYLHNGGRNRKEGASGGLQVQTAWIAPS